MVNFTIRICTNIDFCCVLCLKLGLCGIINNCYEKHNTLLLINNLGRTISIVFFDQFDENSSKSNNDLKADRKKSENNL